MVVADRVPFLVGESAAVIASVMRTPQLNNLYPIASLAEPRTTGTVPTDVAAVRAGLEP